MKRFLSIPATILLLILVGVQCAPATPTSSPALPASPQVSPLPEVDTAKMKDLMRPIDEEIRAYFRSFTSPEAILQTDPSKLVARLLRDYHQNLEELVRLIEQQEGVTLSAEEREIMMREIVEEEITRIGTEFIDQMLGTPEIIIEETVVPVSPPAQSP